MKRDFTKLLDISAEECRYLLKRAAFIKQARKIGTPHKPLAEKTLAMIFEKASTRTRASFEIGITELGGHALVTNAAESQMGRGEPLCDTARVLSRYVHAIMIRTFAQETVDELARWSTVPVINGLTDLYHPCQVLCDLFTIEEIKGPIDGLKIAYVGDGNNMANSWIEASILLGFSLSVATPDGYRPDRALLERAKSNPKFALTNDPREAVEGVDVINTDVWVSMGMEQEKEDRQKAFASYCIDDALLGLAEKDAIVLHCLPAYRNQEITDVVFERFQDVIFSQAENRLHGQKALLEWIMTEELWKA
ncbi:MAG TPA: ornithine carbamoyltransferase [Deltaproteobacteria bacterium]|jgi:ornithine carbamoyltransferase|nr:ornithine carbamoyltransferase [Deltaproteobacteria bacterium]